MFSAEVKEPRVWGNCKRRLVQPIKLLINQHWLTERQLRAKSLVGSRKEYRVSDYAKAAVTLCRTTLPLRLPEARTQVPLRARSTAQIQDATFALANLLALRRFAMVSLPIPARLRRVGGRIPNLVRPPSGHVLRTDNGPEPAELSFAMRPQFSARRGYTILSS